MKFEWDDEKDKLNLKKHGVDFKTAANVFFDNNRIDFLDEEHNSKEERRITIGLVNSLLFVVYTERSENIRLISARKANEKEKNLYVNSIL